MTKRVVNPWSKMTFSSCQILTIGYCDNFALVTSGGISEKHVLKPLYVFAVGPFIWLADPAVVRTRRYYALARASGFLKNVPKYEVLKKVPKDFPTNTFYHISDDT